MILNSPPTNAGTFSSQSSSNPVVRKKTATFKDTLIEPSKTLKGDYEKATYLIVNFDMMSNAEIAKESQITKSKVSALRIKIRRNRNGCDRIIKGSVLTEQGRV